MNSTIKSIEFGIEKDPTSALDDKIFIEGLVQTKTVIERFEELLNGK